MLFSLTWSQAPFLSHPTTALMTTSCLFCPDKLLCVRLREVVESCLVGVLGDRLSWDVSTGIAQISQDGLDGVISHCLSCQCRANLGLPTTSFAMFQRGTPCAFALWPLALENALMWLYSLSLGLWAAQLDTPPPTPPPFPKHFGFSHDLKSTTKLFRQLVWIFSCSQTWRKLNWSGVKA